MSTIEFVDASNVVISSFEHYPMDQHLKYHSIGLDLDLHFNEKSYITCNTLKLTFENGKSKTYQVGDLIFDIGEKESKEKHLDIWESPAASGDETKFPYSYIPDKTITDLKIQYGKDSTQSVSMTEKQEENGEIKLNPKAPLILIRPRILCETINGEEVSYANPCYCGALDITKEDIEKSFTHLKK